ncbi:MAG TPA: metal-dependent transcriptional regulator [Gaiellaceae bacterium]
MGNELTERRSSAVEDYLKAILRLETEGQHATTKAIAERLDVSAPSVTAMAKKLAADGLVERKPYRGVVLTDDGRRVALEVVRHHRLLERYLAERLGLGLDEVHDEAERLEHVLSEELEARIDAELGFPTHDPHGDPIPDRDLQLADGGERSLASLEPGERATVTRVPDTSSDVLRYLAQLSLLPGAAVELVLAAPFDGPLTVRAGGSEHALSRELAAAIGVA